MVLTPQSRLEKHLQKSNLKSNTPKNNWVKKLKKENTLPYLEVLESGFDSEVYLDQAETYYIMLYRALGCQLANVTLGGEGMLGYRHTLEGKAKIASANKKRIWTKESRKKASTAHIGVRITQEQANKLRRALNKPECRRRRSSGYGCRPFTDEQGNVFGCLSEATEKWGVDQSHLSKVLRGVYKKCKGHTFKYVD